MRRIAVLCSSLLLSALPSTSALADNFTFSFSGPSFDTNATVSASGVFSADLINTGEYRVTTITGTANVGTGDQQITSLAAVNTFFGNDNLFFFNAPPSINPDQTFFNFNGLAFFLTNGSGINMYFSSSEVSFDVLHQVSINSNAPITITPGGSITTSPVPEPASLVLCGSGLLAALSAVGRRNIL